MHGRDPPITNKSGEYAIKQNDEIVQYRGYARIIKMYLERYSIKPPVIEADAAG